MILPLVSYVLPCPLSFLPPVIPHTFPLLGSVQSYVLSLSSLFSYSFQLSDLVSLAYSLSFSYRSQPSSHCYIYNILSLYLLCQPSPHLPLPRHHLYFIVTIFNTPSRLIGSPLFQSLSSLQLFPMLPSISPFCLPFFFTGSGQSYGLSMSSLYIFLTYLLLHIHS